MRFFTHLAGITILPVCRLWLFGR